MTLGQGILLVAIMAISVLTILVILIQRGRGEGLAGAFGGGGGGSAFGAKTGDVFTGITVAFACVFLLLNVLGNYVFLPPSADAAAPARQPANPLPESTTMPVSVPVKAVPVQPNQAPPPAAPTPEAPAPVNSAPPSGGGNPEPAPAPGGSETP